MRKVVVFFKPKSWWNRDPDIDYLNSEIAKVEKEGWSIVSASSNTNIFGLITSFTVLVEYLE
ncbi:hypothetical protein EYS14_10870 [Alteromonadaceae bacterium M269]|nr:hypothetical protein EYS14_10870 [Alteromonadaceae bacterium M269]